MIQWEKKLKFKTIIKCSYKGNYIDKLGIDDGSGYALVVFRRSLSNTNTHLLDNEQTIDFVTTIARINNIYPHYYW